MNIWQMRREINEAKEVLNNADNVAKDIAPLLVGRLRSCSGFTLEKLKKELRDFNAHTHKWKDQS